MALEQPQVKPKQAAMLRRQKLPHTAKSWVNELDAAGLESRHLGLSYSVGPAVNAIEMATSDAVANVAIFGMDRTDANAQFFEHTAAHAWFEAAREAHVGMFATTIAPPAPDLTLGLLPNAIAVENSEHFQPGWVQAALGREGASWAFLSAQYQAANVIEVGAHKRPCVAVADQRVPTIYSPGPWGSWASYVDTLRDPERSAPEQDVLLEILKLNDGWDGEGSLAPSSEAAGSAVEVFGRLSAYMAEAEIEVDGSTGDIGLTWYFDEHRSAVSLTILANGRVIVVSALAGRSGWRETLTPAQFNRLNRIVVDAGLHLIDG